MGPDTRAMPRLRLPRTVFRHAVVQTSEDAYEATRVNADLEEVTLDGLCASVPAGASSEDVGCVYAIMNLWNWRSRAKQRRDKRSRDDVIGNIQNITEKINAHDARQVELEQEIKQSLETKDKVRARRLLMQKKRTTNMIHSLNVYRDELENVLISLEESNEQQELVASFKTASRVLKSHTGAKGRAVEEYDYLADELQEAQQDVEELQQAVSSRVGPDPDIEEELDAMFPSTGVVRPSPGEPPPSTAFALPEVPKTALDLMQTPKTDSKQFSVIA